MTRSLCWTVIAGILVAAGSLSACSSADSDQSAQPSAESSALQPTTASPADDSDVEFIDCVGAPQRRPTAISADCTQTYNRVTDIEWDEWGEDTAEGSGTTTAGKDVTIELSEPVATGDATVFSVVTIDGVTVSS